MLVAREKARQKRNAARRARYAAKKTQGEGEVKNKMLRISCNSKPGATRKAARASRAALAVTAAASAADAPAQVVAADILSEDRLADEGETRMQ